MIKVKVRIAPGSEDLQLPTYVTEGSAAADVRAAVTDEVTIAPGKRALIPTGLHLEIPNGFEIQVRPRSGLALKNGITLLNAPGTIDSDYRGELQLIVMNLGNEPFTVKRGDRIAQLVLSPVIKAIFEHSRELEQTQRGEGGFGSTGV